MALTQTQVSQLYVSIFNRASEGNGNTYWQTNGADLASVATEMLATTDAATYFGSSLDTNQAFVEHIYLNTLNKTTADDAAGIAYWVAELDSGVSRGQMVANLVTAATLAENAGAAQDQFNNRVTVSNYTADTLAAAPTDYSTSLSFASGLTVTSDAATVTAAQTTIDNLVNAGETFTLTAATAGQILVGTSLNDTFVGDKDSISADDKLIDGSTTDNDTANLSFNGAMPALTIANVENVNATISNISAVTSVDGTNFTGVKNLTVTKTDVTVGSSTLTGNKAVTVTAINGEQITKVTAGAGTTDVAVTQGTKAGVTVDANTATGNVTVTGAATVTANAMGTGDTLTVTAVDSDAGSFTTNATTENAKAVSITTTAETVVVANETTGVTTDKFTGAITVDAATSKNVTVANAAGGVTITAAGETGTAGTDGIVVGGIDQSGATITTSYAGTSTAKGVIAVTGTSTADVATIAAAGTTTLSNTGVETLNLSGNAAAVTFEVSSSAATTYNVTGTESVTISNSAANMTGKTVNNATVVAITTGSNDLDASNFTNVGKISISDAIGANQITVVDGQNVEFTSATQSALDFDYATGAKNVNITVGDVNGTSTAIGTLSVGAFDASAGASDVGTVKITADESKFTATSTTIGAKQTLELLGSKDYTLGVVTAKELNATAATGVISASNGSGTTATVATMNTGSGKDTLTTNTTSVITINSATGDDTITLTKAGATSEISTGEGNDTVNIASATATAAFVVVAGDGDDTVSMDGAIDAVLVAGNGTDTLKITATSDESAKTNFAISGFEKFDMTTTAAIDVTLTAAQFANNNTVELSGAGGNDTFTVVAASTGSTINASGLTVKSGADVTVSYTGSSKADTITGGTAAENFIMTAGADSIEGGSGSAVDKFTAAIVADTGTAVAAVINLGGSAITATDILAQTSYRTAGDASVAANTAVSLFNDTTSTNVASVTTLGGIESVVGTTAKDYIVASSTGTTIQGAAGNDYIKLGAGIDTLVFSASGSNGLDTVSGYTAGSGGDVMNFATTLGATKQYAEATLAGLGTGTLGDNVIVITDAQTTWTSAAAIDTALAAAFTSVTGAAIVIFKTSASGDAQVWYDSAINTDGTASSFQVATLVGLTDLTTLATDNFITA